MKSERLNEPNIRSLTQKEAGELLRKVGEEARRKNKEYFLGKRRRPEQTGLTEKTRHIIYKG